jgi:chromosome segregation ATPase
MTDFGQIIDRMEQIQLKLNTLTMRLNFAEKDLAQAKYENDELKKKLKTQNPNLVATSQDIEVNNEKDFDKRDFFHKLVKNYSNDGATQEQLRTLLEEYIKDIDHSIALLSN